MATRDVNITIRLHIGNDNVDEITDEDLQEVLNEMDYNFSNDGDFKIIDTEICGIND